MTMTSRINNNNKKTFRFVIGEFTDANMSSRNKSLQNTHIFFNAFPSGFVNGQNKEIQSSCLPSVRGGEGLSWGKETPPQIHLCMLNLHLLDRFHLSLSARVNKLLDHPARLYRSLILAALFSH